MLLPDIDAPLQTKVGSIPEPSAEQIQMISDMGFTTGQARKALKETVHKSYRSPRGLAHFLPAGW